jgi:plasmid stabilization system protein ParE
MASKPLRFHPEAEEDYLTALSWYRERSLLAASNFEAVFSEAIHNISNAPLRWPLYIADFRKYTLRQFPFSVLYKDLPSQIVIYAVAHGHRRPGYWKHRV